MSQEKEESILKLWNDNTKKGEFTFEGFRKMMIKQFDEKSKLQDEIDRLNIQNKHLTDWLNRMKMYMMDKNNFKKSKGSGETNY